MNIEQIRSYHNFFTQEHNSAIMELSDIAQLLGVTEDVLPSVYRQILWRSKVETARDQLLILCTARACRQTTRSGIECLPLDVFRILQGMLFPRRD